MTAVVVIPHDVPAFEAALGGVMQTVEVVNAVERGTVCVPIIRRSGRVSGLGVVVLQSVRLTVVFSPPLSDIHQRHE